MVDHEKVRRFSRKTLGVEVRVREAGDTTSGDIAFDTIDISEGGAFLQSDFLFEVGDLLEMSFAIPDLKNPVEAEARVVWVTRVGTAKGRAGMGVQFKSLDEQARLAIGEFVRSD